MGIARRKAGSIVRCPTCAGQVVVPDPGPGALGPQNPDAEPGLFDRDDIGALFQNPTQPVGGSAGRGPAPSSRPHAPGAQLDVEPVALPDLRAPQRGMFLSSGKVVLLSVLVFLLLGLTFFAGFLVGRSP